MESRGIETGKKLMNIVNSYNVQEITDFVNVVTTDHRTLQQSAFRTFMKCVEVWAENYESGNYDLRNEQTCKMSAEIKKLFEDNIYVPMI